MSDRWRTKGRFADEYTWTTRQTVRVTTLDALIDDFGTPQFCKIDVEGFEREVISGLSKPVPYLSFEFTSEFFADAKACIDKLQQLGDVRFNCSLAESLRFLLPGWSSAESVVATLEREAPGDVWGDIYAHFRDTATA